MVQVQRFPAVVYKIPVKFNDNHEPGHHFSMSVFSRLVTVFTKLCTRKMMKATKNRVSRVMPIRCKSVAKTVLCQLRKSYSKISYVIWLVKKN